jgi:hypothetical protein
VRIENREAFLKIAVGAVVGLFLLDRMVLTPAGKSWTAQGERIDALREKVTKGHRLLQNENALRAKWAAMQSGDLDPEISTAEDQAYSGISKWAAASRISTTSLSPQWRTQDDDFDLFEFRASATGTQSSLGQFIYALETDPLPVKLEECDLTARDAKGQQLTGALRFSFIRLKTSNARP